MPIYEYVCSGCGLKFELLRPISKSDEGAICPNCHESAERILSAFACFSKSNGGVSSPIAGAGSSCSSCAASSCDTCDV